MAGQNTSSAVMAQRHEPHDSLDDFPTQPWGTRALCEHVICDYIAPGQKVIEPAANRGFMVRPLTEYFDQVEGFDVFDYGGGFEIRDFLFGDPLTCDWVISNPPFKLAEAFIRQAFRSALVGVAMLVRSSFLEGVGRFKRLFSEIPPSTIAQFAERLPLVKGRLDKKASTATAYCWLVWRSIAGRFGADSNMGPEYVWIPPCRKKLERPDDYPCAPAPSSDICQGDLLKGVPA